MTTTGHIQNYRKMDKEQLLLDTLNLMIQSLEPISYFRFNQIFKENNEGILEKIESENIYNCNYCNNYGYFN